MLYCSIQKVAAAGGDLPCACRRENWPRMDTVAGSIDGDVVVVDSEIVKVLHIFDSF